MADDCIPAWMKNGCAVLYQKGPRIYYSRKLLSSYISTTVRKLSTGVIAKEMYDYLEQKKLFPEEQK